MGELLESDILTWLMLPLRAVRGLTDWIGLGAFIKSIGSPAIGAVVVIALAAFVVLTVLPVLALIAERSRSKHTRNVALVRFVLGWGRHGRSKPTKGTPTKNPTGQKVRRKP